MLGRDRCSLTTDYSRVEERARRRARPVPPSSNRTCGFPASGSRISSRLRACAACWDTPLGPETSQGPRREHGRPLGRPLWDARRPSGWSLLLPWRAVLRPLRSTGITPLPRYYEPVRLPAVADRRVMSSAAAVNAAAPHAGPPRFLDRSVRARRPHSPRKARRVHMPVASPSVSGFTISGRLATFTRCNEAVSGSLALRLTRSLPGASPRGLLHATSESLPVERAIDRVTSFHVTRSVRLFLAHRISRTERVPLHP